MNDPSRSLSGYRIRLMIPPVRHLFRLLAAIGAAGTILSILLTVSIGTPQSPEPPPGNSPDNADTPPPHPESREHLLDGIEEVLLPPSQNAPGALAKRFRLAGTIFGVSDGGANEPMAVLDDRIEVRQSIVSRFQEVIPGVVLAAVSPESVTLSGPDGEEQIFLEKAPHPLPPSPPSQEKADETKTPVGPKTRAEAAKRFGGREVFPNRWMFSREQVLSYYDELRNEPERLLQIFDSMDPVYVTDPDGESRIDGYRVGVEGEADFFAAAGLREGDVVKSVNKLLMANRRRAEALIASFIEGRGTMFVFEIERDGKTIQEVVEFE